MEPLVSVIILTYNAQHYILDTLESIKKQIYKNIELIISDDCSNDLTLTLADNWSEKNKQYFKDIKILKSATNYGTVINANRAAKVANGKFLKFLGGDDILLDKCIASNVYYAEKNNIDLVFSKMKFFIEENGEYSIIKTTPDNNQMKFFYLNPQKQYEYLIKKSFNIAPTAFIRKDTFFKLGGFDEDYKIFEDLPFWTKATKTGYKLEFFDEETVMYRRNIDSASQTTQKVVNELFFSDLYKFYVNVQRPYLVKKLSLLHLIDQDIKYYQLKKIIEKGNKPNNNSLFLKLLNIINPMYYKRKLALIFKKKTL